MPINITNEEFLKGIFGKDFNDAHVCAFSVEPNDTSHPGRWKGDKYRDTEHYRWHLCNSFYTVSTFSGPDRRDPMAEQLFVLVVDDVGPNGKATLGDWLNELERRAGRAIHPTYKIETSPGNYHLGYAIKGVDTHAKATMVMMQWMDLVLSVFGKDPGNAGLTRYVRLPVGINNKPLVVKALGKPWDVKLHVWEPSRIYNGGKFARVIGLSDEMWERACRGEYHSNVARLNSAAEASTGATHLDAEDDPTGWGKALYDRGLIGKPHKPGAWDIECPFIDEHTERDQTGAAYIGDGVIKCHHRCSTRNPAEFRDKLEKLYPGIAAEAASHVLGDPGGGGGGGQALSQDEKDYINKNTKEKREQEKIFERYALVPQGRGYFMDLDANVDMSPASVSLTLHKHKKELAARAGLWSPGQKGAIPGPDKSLAEKCKRARDVEYAPGLPRVFRHKKPGYWTVNTWRGAELKGSTEDGLGWTLFVELVKRVAGDDKYKLMLDWLAMVVGCPEEKPGWQWLLVSAPGLGKDTLGTIMTHVLGPDNAQTISGGDLTGKWSEWAARKLIIVTELSSQVHAGRRAGATAYDSIKMFLSNMPETLTIEEKYGRRQTARNVGAYLMFSNHDFALLLDKGERRLCIVDRSGVGLESTAYWTALKTQVVGSEDAWATIRYNLKRRWDKMNMGARDVLRGVAPDTEAKRSMVAASGSPLDVFVDDILGGEDLFVTGGELQQRWRDARRHDGLRTGYPMTVEALVKGGMFHAYGKHPKGQVRGIGVVWALREDGKMTKKNKLKEGTIRGMVEAQIKDVPGKQNGGASKIPDIGEAFEDAPDDLDPLDFC